MTSLLPAILLLAPSAPPAAPAGAQKVDFNRDVRPILADHCFQCHGPDTAKRKANLRLDVDPSAQKRDHPIIVPGKTTESELIRRITTDEPADRMPPSKFARPLTAKQIDTLKA